MHILVCPNVAGKKNRNKANNTTMDEFKIIKGFRNARDIDRASIIYDKLSSWKDCVSFLKEKNLKGLTVKPEEYKNKFSVDFSFLREMSILEYFEWLVPLTKKSDISELHSLHNLKYLRWLADNSFKIDFSKSPHLETLLTSYYSGMENWDTLTGLKVLHISKLKNENCEFIRNLKELTDLTLSSSDIISIKGVEECSKLERLDLIHCIKISSLAEVLGKCPQIISVSLRKCKNINKDEIKKIEDLGISLWVE